MTNNDDLKDIQTRALARLKDYLESVTEELNCQSPDWAAVQSSLRTFLELEMTVFPMSIKRLEMARINDLINLALAEAELEDKIRDTGFIRERVGKALEKLANFEKGGS